MTIKDRILCAFGFHGPLKFIQSVDVYEWGLYTFPVYRKLVYECTLCRRPIKKKI